MKIIVIFQKVHLINKIIVKKCLVKNQSNQINYSQKKSIIEKRSNKKRNMSMIYQKSHLFFINYSKNNKKRHIYQQNDKILIHLKNVFKCLYIQFLLI